MLCDGKKTWKHTWKLFRTYKRGRESVWRNRIETCGYGLWLLNHLPFAKMTYKNSQQHEIPREAPPKHMQATPILRCVINFMSAHSFVLVLLIWKTWKDHWPRFFAADENAVNHKVHHAREKYVRNRRVCTSWSCHTDITLFLDNVFSYGFWKHFSSCFVMWQLTKKPSRWLGIWGQTVSLGLCRRRDEGSYLTSVPSHRVIRDTTGCCTIETSTQEHLHKRKHGDDWDRDWELRSQNHINLHKEQKSLTGSLKYFKRLCCN